MELYLQQVKVKMGLDCMHLKDLLQSSKVQCNQSSSSTRGAVSNTMAQILTLFPNKMVGHWPFSYAELLKWGFMMKMRATVAADEFMKATGYMIKCQLPKDMPLNLRQKPVVFQSCLGFLLQ